MATSALQALANATVAFEIAGAGVVTDPDTGNVYAAKSEVSYTAFLKAVNVDPALFPGVDANGIIYEGYVINPQSLSSKVGIGSTGTLTFGSGQPVGFEMVRSRLGYGDTGTLGSILTNALGTKITLLAKE
jgi:hypothetical protein